MYNVSFFVTSILLGVGLAMDAFSVSIANGLNEPKMSKGRMLLISGTFCVYQIAMPLIGWVCVKFLADTFAVFNHFVPIIALCLLLYIGGKMIIEGIKSNGETEKPAVGFAALMVQGIATSIDALSVGFTIEALPLTAAIVESVIIGVVTLAICIAGLIIGKLGTKISALSNKASILGGCILCFIGIKIFIEGFGNVTEAFNDVVSIFR